MKKKTKWKIMLAAAMANLFISIPILANASEAPHQNKLIIVGDSRTYNMSQWITPTCRTEFVAKNGQGYSWFEEEAVEKVNKIIRPGDSIVIWLGVNDYFNNIDGDYSWMAYSKKINSLSENEWSQCKIYVAAVGYVDSKRMKDYYGKVTRTNVTRLKGSNSIKGIQEFNINLHKSLNQNITWLDTFEVIGIENSDTGYIPENFWATRPNGKKDGLHYGQAKTQQIYKFFVDSTKNK